MRILNETGPHLFDHHDTGLMETRPHLLDQYDAGLMETWPHLFDHHDTGREDRHDVEDEQDAREEERPQKTPALVPDVEARGMVGTGRQTQGEMTICIQMMCNLVAVHGS